jgi:tetratricopeptide (TPR) repeat protein
MILGELGILHADVGNFRIALGYLLDRDKLPYSDNSEGLDAMLSEAQSLLHVGREADAAALADRALGVIDRNPALARYRLLALDWAAVCHLAAGHFARALVLYGEEIPLLPADTTSVAERNRIVLRVARAAAAVGAGQPSLALTDLDYVDAHLAGAGPALQWPHATREHVVETYRLIAAGLRANAYRALGREDDEARAIESRLSILERQRAETHRSVTAHEELLAWADLAWNASRRRDAALAARSLTCALAIVDDLRVHDLGITGRPGLDTLRLAAELSTSMGTTLVPTLSFKIDAVSAELATRRDPELGAYQRWFEIYGTLLAPIAAAAPKPAQ